MIKKNLFNKINIPILLIFLIPLVLVIFWFREGDIMATAESGIPFYNPTLQFNVIKDAWASFVLGYPTNVGVAAKPAYWLLSLLQNIGIPNFLLQASFFWFVLVISGVSIYLISRELFPHLEPKIYLLAALFYWFNPLSLVNVWNRFLNNFIVFYAFLPLVFLLFLIGIRTKKYIFAILIALVSLLFSYASSSIAFSLILWSVLLYTALFYLVFYKQVSKLFVINFFFLSFLFWSLVNFWWISQILSYVGLGSFTAVTSTSFKIDTNYQTFSVLSQKLGNLTDLLRLKHASFFANKENMDWVGIYKFPVLTILEFLFAGIFLFPIIIKRKQFGVLFIGGLLILSIFFAKGNNPPLGEIFDKAFVKLSILQLFRNPLEKIGFIIPLAAAPLFCLGVSLLISKSQARWRKILYLLSFGWLFVVWGTPFWSSLVFTGTESPTNNINVGYQVKVPSFYKDASNWLSSQGNNFRLVIFPIGGEGITYTWPKGYSGVELSNQILPVTSISFNTNIPFYDGISSNLERIFLARKDFSKILDALNIRYIVVRSDIDWRVRKMRDPKTIHLRMQTLESEGRFKKVNQFGDLIFWEYLGWKDQTIYSVGNVVRANAVTSIEDLLNTEKGLPVVLYDKGEIPSEEWIKEEIIHPIFKFGLGNQSIEPSIILREDIIFPAVRILPSNYLYPLILLKEKFEQWLISDRNYKIVKKISLLGKRLVEANNEASLQNFNGVQRAVDNYQNQLKELYDFPLGDTLEDKNEVFIQEDLYKLFLKHFSIIDHLESIYSDDKESEIANFKTQLKEFLVNKGIQPIFDYQQSPNYPIKARTTYQFIVEKQGSYELLFNIKNWSSYFKQPFSESIFFQIDQNLVQRKGELKGNQLLSFGFFNLTLGKHEIGWNAPDAINLIDSPSEFLLTVDHGISERQFPIKFFDPYSTYILNLNYLIKKGSGVRVSIEGNNDLMKKNIIQRHFSKFLSSDNYDFDLRKYVAYYSPPISADNAILILSVIPWNNCEDIYRTRGKQKCIDEEFRRPYDRTTEVLIKDVALFKLVTEAPILRLENKSYSKDNLPNVTFTKVNEAEYKVNVIGAENPFTLVLSQLFDPSWKVYEDNKEIGNKHFLANSYANGWQVDKVGSYQLIIKFVPQDLLPTAEKVSLIAFTIGSILIIWILGRKYVKKS